MGVSKCPPAPEGLSLRAPAPSCSYLQARLAALSTGGRGQCCRGAGRGRSRALLTNYRCVGGAEDRDGQTGWRRKSDSAHSPACARTCPLLPTPVSPGGFQEGRPAQTSLLFCAGAIPELAPFKPRVHPVSVCKVGKKLPEAPLVEASPQTGEVYGAPIWETARGWREPSLQSSCCLRELGKK